MSIFCSLPMKVLQDNIPCLFQNELDLIMLYAQHSIAFLINRSIYSTELKNITTFWFCDSSDVNCICSWDQDSIYVCLRKGRFIDTLIKLRLESINWLSTNTTLKSVIPFRFCGKSVILSIIPKNHGMIRHQDNLVFLIDTPNGLSVVFMETKWRHCTILFENDMHKQKLKTINWRLVSCKNALFLIGSIISNNCLCVYVYNLKFDKQKQFYWAVLPQRIQYFMCPNIETVVCANEKIYCFSSFIVFIFDCNRNRLLSTRVPQQILAARLRFTHAVVSPYNNFIIYFPLWYCGCKQTLSVCNHYNTNTDKWTLCPHLQNTSNNTTINPGPGHVILVL